MGGEVIQKYILRSICMKYNEGMFDPKYQITNKILKNIGAIEAAREVVMDAPLLPLWEKQFKDDAVTRTVYHGTHIEGNRLGYSDAKDLLTGSRCHRTTS